MCPMNKLIRPKLELMTKLEMIDLFKGIISTDILTAKEISSIEVNTPSDIMFTFLV